MSSHIAYLTTVTVNRVGTVINKNAASLYEIANSHSETRIQEDISLPNTIGYPTIKRYLELEDADGYQVQQLNRLYVVTLLAIGNMLRADLEMFYRLESDGTDSSGKDRHLEFTSGSPTYVPGRFGNALSMNNTSDILITAQNYPSPGTSDFSVSLWRKGVVTSGQMFGKGRAASAPGFAMFVNALGPVIRLRDSTTAVVAQAAAATNFNDGDWHNAIVTADRDGLATVYVDGVAVGSNNITTAAGSLDGVSLWGLHSTGLATSIGLYDSIAVVFRLFTAQEIAYLQTNSLY